jgi:hypothetical protein
MGRLVLAVAATLLLAALPPAAWGQDVIRGEVIPLDQSSVQIAVDSRQPLGQVGDATSGPSYRLRGWAVDRQATGGPGIRQIVAYLDGPSGRGRLLGWARYGLARPDVATVFNDPARTPCGFELTWPVENMPLQIEPVHQYTVYLYVDTASGWVLARVPVALAVWTDSGQTE